MLSIQTAETVTWALTQKWTLARDTTESHSFISLTPVILMSQGISFLLFVLIFLGAESNCTTAAKIFDPSYTARVEV